MTIPSSLSPSTTALYALKVAIRIVGKKASEQWIEDGISIYTKRMQAIIDLETVWHKDDASLCQGVDGDVAKGYTIVCLDPCGKHHTSESFTDNLYRWFESGGSRVSFVIGGAEGLPPSLRPSNANSGGSSRFSLSLSDMTLPHQLARLFLVEQVYRASEIRKGSA
jgi:23S rRNA (pseudouridine1915-N3)-methyltransferase